MSRKPLAVVEYDRVEKVFVEGDRVPLLKRKFRVVAGEPCDATRLLRLAGFNVQPKVVHPNGSGGTEAYLYLTHPTQRVPTKLY